MRVGVLSDAHANLAGLSAAVQAMGSVDRYVFAGDVLGYYFESPAVIDRLRELGADCILGNHDVYFLSHLGVPVDTWSAPVPSADAYQKRYGPSLERAARELDKERVQWLGSLRPQVRLEVGGTRVLVTHGSPWNPVHEYVYPDYAAFARFAELEDVDLVIMGHTHRPLVRREGRVTLLNPGSCGQPRDGDPRAAFAIVEVATGAVSCELGRAVYDQAPLLRRCAEVAPENRLIVDLLRRGSA